MKSCELCKSAAMMFCESDQASLCWDCDAKVHSANFLVARHSRTLLCRVCQSPTPWNASGEKLGRTVSVCVSCVDGCGRVKENRGGDEESEGGYDGETDGEEEEEEVEVDDDVDEVEDQVDDDDEDGDNQVVPWSSTPPPPPAESSSSSEESSSRYWNGGRAILSKQLSNNAADLSSDEDNDCSSSHRKNSSPAAEAAASVRYSVTETAVVDSSSRPLKRQRTEPNRSSLAGSGKEISDLNENRGAVRSGLSGGQ